MRLQYATLLIIGIIAFLTSCAHQGKHKADDYTLQIKSSKNTQHSPVLSLKVIDKELETYGLANVLVNDRRYDLLTDTALNLTLKPGQLEVSAVYLGKKHIEIEPITTANGDSILLTFYMTDAKANPDTFSREDFK